jgi:hypothetical protein
MVEEFGLTTELLLRLFSIVRGADTVWSDSPPKRRLAGRLFGLSPMYAYDLEPTGARQPPS